jgi:hypothetical protein
MNLSAAEERKKVGRVRKYSYNVSSSSLCAELTGVVDSLRPLLEERHEELVGRARQRVRHPQNQQLAPQEGPHSGVAEPRERGGTLVLRAVGPDVDVDVAFGAREGLLHVAEVVEAHVRARFVRRLEAHAVGREVAPDALEVPLQPRVLVRLQAVLGVDRGFGRGLRLYAVGCEGAAEDEGPTISIKPCWSKVER